jgi:hypothetical protein
MAYDLRVLGYGSVVSVDDNDSGSVFTVLSGCTSITPPDKEWFKVDGSTLDDAFEVIRGGTQKATEFVFAQVWIVKSTNHEIIDTLFGTKNPVLWNVVYPQGTAVTDSFEGYVSKVTAAVKGPNEYWMREITVQATSLITRT